MRNFKVYINFTCSNRVREYSNFDDFTLTRSNFVIHDFSVDLDNITHNLYDGYPCSNVNKRLRSDIDELCLLALDFCGISRSRVVESLSISDCHVIDLVVSCFESCEKDILKLESGSYFHSTGYFDDSVNPCSVEVSVKVIELND